jgi:hypothetical protein
MSDCPRWPGSPPCQTAIKNPPCPGAKACAEFWGERVRRADAELARRRVAGEPPERWATTAEDLGGEEELVWEEDVSATG